MSKSRVINGLRWTNATPRDRDADEAAALAAHDDDYDALAALWRLGYDCSSAFITRS